MPHYMHGCLNGSKWFGLLDLTSVVISQYCFPSTGYVYLILLFLEWWHLHLDEDLGRDIRHDDVYCMKN